MKAAAIYARVSSAAQVDGTSLDAQVKTCHEYAGAQGYRIVDGGVVQEDISGALLNRPGLNKIVELAAHKQIDAVILAKVDRLARGRMVDALLEADLRSYGIEVLYVNRDTTTPEGRLLVNIEKDFAEWERERIRERTWGGRLERAKAGGVMVGHTPPYGYEKSITGTTTASGRTVPIRGLQVLEAEARWVRQMFEWLVDERCTLGEIMRRLNHLGVPTKKGARCWQRAGVAVILSSSLYAGDWYWNKRKAVEARKPHGKELQKDRRTSHALKPEEEWIHVPCPAIISRELFDAAQHQLQRNKAKAGRPGTRNDLLKGLLVCSFCGRRLCASTRNDKYKYRQYSCTGHRIEGLRETCRSAYLTAHKVESELWEKIAEYLSNEDVLLAFIRERERNREPERRRDQARLAELVEADAAIKRERDKLLDFALAEPPLIDRETLQDRTQQLDKRAATNKAARAEVEARMRDREAVTVSEADIKIMCARARARAPHLTEAEKRQWLEVLDLHGTVYAKGVEFAWVVGEPFMLLLDKHAAGDNHDLYTGEMFCTRNCTRGCTMPGLPLGAGFCYCELALEAT